MGITMFARRLRWVLRALGRNPLVRASDRLEALAVLGVLVLALLAAPFAAHVGDLTFDASMRTVNEQSRDRHAVQAVVVRGSTGMPADFESSAMVSAQWREGSRLRTEEVISPASVEAGAPLTIWLDDEGKVVAAPLTAFDAKVNSVGLAWTVWVTAVASGTLGAFLLRRILDRSRARAWEQELQLMAHNDDGWANRHT
jgi:hypothetical protein